MSYRVVVITNGCPHPRLGASAVVFFEYLEGLKKQNFKVLHLMLLTPEELETKDASDYIKEIVVDENFQVAVTSIPHRHKKIALRNLRITVPDLPPETARLVHGFNADFAICFDILTVAHAKALGLNNIIAWLGDFSFETVFWHAWYDWQQRPGIPKTLVKSLIVAEVWKRFYLQNLRGRISIVVAAASSVSKLRRMGLRSEFIPYPWPDAQKFDGSSKKPLTPRFVLFGTLNALGAKSALLFLYKKVYPRLLSAWGSGGFEILVAGVGAPPKWAQEFSASRREVRFVGFVDDLHSLVKSCHGVLAPVSVPVGNRTRVVATMAMAAPIVAHKNTALGNPALLSGQNCLLASSAEEFSKKMIRLYEDQSLADLISLEARRSYEDLYLPKVAVANFIDYCERQVRS